MSFENKIAVVTGAASGIGQATAEALAMAGATVIVADINSEKGEAAAASIRGKGQQAMFLQVDITDGESIDVFAKAVDSHVGAIDILVNGAGWGQTKPFVEGAPELWDKLISLNFVGPMRLVKALLPKMMERGSGKIVNIASDAGRVGSLGETIYSGCQGRADRFHQIAGARNGTLQHQRQLRVPGPHRDAAIVRRAGEKLEAFRKAIPFRRFAKPSEIADAVVFFASDRSSYITGQVLSVSGGLTMVG